MAMFFPGMGMQYVKKEDVRMVADRQRIFIGTIFAAMAVVVGIIYFSVRPNLLEIYLSFGAELPVMVHYSGWLMVALIVLDLGIGAFCLTSKSDYSKADTVALEYKDGEMIHVSKIIPSKTAWMILGFLVIAIGITVYSTVVPIYSLTSDL